MSDILSTITLRGGKPLEGTIELHGAKNALPKEMVAALLTPETCILSNVSEVSDVALVSTMITAMGGTVERHGLTLTITADHIRPLGPDELDQYAGKSRIPILMCGPMLNRFGKVVIPQLGGCNIGQRPVDFHIMALTKMGAEIEEDENYITLQTKRLHGTSIHLNYPSVGATEQVLLASVLANGQTELTNAAIEPEIVDLICVLQKMGALISVETDRTIIIKGVDELHGYDHFCIPDRMEAASWGSAAIATNGRITVKGARQIDLLTFLNKFHQIGGGFSADETGVTFWRASKEIQPVTLSTDVHPGFMTDWQQPFVVALTQANGTSIVHETVYEERFGYTETLNQMGADIELSTDCLDGRTCRFKNKDYRHSAIIHGPTPLHGQEVTIPDLRAGFSYVIAALIADGQTTLHKMETIARGYEHFEDKLENIGAGIVTTE